MWFKITDGGTDYVRVTMDVHNDQLRDVMRAVTEAAEPPAPEDTEGVELGGPDCGDGAEGPEGGDA